MNGVGVIAAHALREGLRRRVFVVVLVLTLVFLALFALATTLVERETRDLVPLRDIGTLDGVGLVASTMLGLGMFATLFLSAVLAIFLTLGAVRGDAERGLLQPLVVRPLGRAALLLGRFLAAAAVCAGYVVVVYAATAVITHQVFGRWPDTALAPALSLAGAAIVIVALALLGSVFLTSTANGIVTFMLFGAGLVGGLMQSIANAIGSDSLDRIAHVVSLALPFEALYQAGLHALTADQTGFTGALIQLGPFGASRGGGPLLTLWVVAYVALACGLAIVAFRRRDV